MSDHSTPQSNGGQAPPTRSRFYRLGAFSFRKRWPVLVVWLLVLFLAAPFLQKLSGRLSQGGFEVPGECLVGAATK